MANIEKRTSKKGKLSYFVKIRLKVFSTQQANYDSLTDARKFWSFIITSNGDGNHRNSYEYRS